MSKTKFISLFLICIISIIIFDYSIFEEKVLTERFKEFDCHKYSISYKGGTGSYCNLICLSGKKIHLPNNVDFPENLKNGDEIRIAQTSMLGFNKKILFRYFDRNILVKISDLDNHFIYYIFIVSIFFHLLYLKFSEIQLFQVLYGLFTTLDVVVLFFYIKSH